MSPSFRMTKCLSVLTYNDQTMQGKKNICFELVAVSLTSRVVVALDRDIHPLVTSWHLLGHISPERCCVVGW